MSTRWIRWFVVGAVSVAGVAPAAAVEMARWGAPQAPEVAGTLAPCCEEGAEAVELPGGDGPREGRRHQLIDEATLQALRDEAEVSPAVPRGTDVGLAESSPYGSNVEPYAANIGARFEGLDILDGCGGTCAPPDTIVAASETKVLEAVNTALRLSRRGGTAPLERSLNDFFLQSPEAYLTDPKVYFDRLSGRFFVVILGQSDVPQKSFIFLAVSRGSDPSGLDSDDWCKYSINSRREGSFADYPGLGVNESWVAVSVNNFRFSNFAFNSAFIYAIPKATLVNNLASCPSGSYRGFKPAVDLAGNPAATVQPAQHYTTTNLSGHPLYFVSTEPLSLGKASSTSYTVWAIEGTGAEATLTRSTVNASQPYMIPPNAPQLGGPDLDTGDMRITQAAFRDGKLWAVHATACSLGLQPNESCVRALELTPDAGGVSLAFEETFGVEDWYGFWPGIAINRRGDVVAPFQRSRADRHLDTAYGGKLAAATMLDPIRTFKKGTCPLFDVAEGSETSRTGDYVGAQTDPLDDLGFWVAGEYAGPLPVVGCDWRTWVGRLTFPSPQLAAQGVAAPGTLSGAPSGAPGDPPAGGQEPLTVPSPDAGSGLRGDFDRPHPKKPPVI